MSDEKCLICDHYICNHGRYGCHVDGCKCVRTCYVADHPNYAERAAEIERLRARMAELEAAAKELADGWTNKHVVNTDLDRRIVNMILAWDRPRYEAKIAESARAANGGEA